MRKSPLAIRSVFVRFLSSKVSTRPTERSRLYIHIERLLCPGKFPNISFTLDYISPAFYLLLWNEANDQYMRSFVIAGPIVPIIRGIGLNDRSREKKVGIHYYLAFVPQSPASPFSILSALSSISAVE